MGNNVDGVIGDCKASSRSLWAVLTVQTQNAFNDNVVRYALLGVALMVLAEGSWMHSYYKNLITGLISLPFVLLAPLAGWVSDRYTKSSVIKTCLYFQIGIIGLIVVAMLVKSIWLATAGFFILAVQSAFFGPAKFGILKELVGSRGLTKAAGLMQMFTILAIVIGAVAGGEGFKQARNLVAADPWIAGLIPIGIVGVGSFLALWFIRGLSPTPAYPVEPLGAKVFFGHFDGVAEIFRSRTLGLSCLGISFFWFSGSFAMTAFIQVAQENYPRTHVAAYSSYYLAATSVGIAVGSVVVSVISSNRIELGLVPLGGLGLALSVLLCAIVPPQAAWFYVGLFSLGTTSAMFLVPQNAFLQEKADPQRKGRIIAASNLVNSAASLAAAWVAQPALQAVGWSSSVQFLVLGTVSLGVSIYALKLLPMDFVRVLFKIVIKLFYRIRVVGEQHLPLKGGALLISNHVTWIDSMLIGAAASREVRFVAYEGFFKAGIVAKVLKLFKVIPISATQARKAIKQTSAGVKDDGSLVCLFPEGTLTRTGTLSELQKGFELIARQSDGAPVIPVRLDRAWGSIFSFAGNKFFKKRPRQVPYPVSVVFGEPVRGKPTSEHVRDEMMRLSVTAYAERTELRCTLAEALIRGLKRRSGELCLVDRSADRGSRFTRRRVLSSGLGLAKRWRRAIGSSTVAVAMPPSSASVLTHAGLALAGKAMVNLPLDVQPEDVAKLRKALSDLEVDTVITSKAHHKALAHLPWPDKVIYVSDELRAVQGTGKLLARWRVACTPKWWLLGTFLYEDSESAALGVLVDDACAEDWHYRMMTHREVLTAATQIDDTNVFRPSDRLLSSYQMHCLEGQIFGVWLPLLHRLPLVVPSIGSKRATPEVLIQSDGVTVVIGDASGVAGLQSALGDNVRMVITFDTAASFEGIDRLYRGCCSSRTGVIWSMSMADAESGGVKHIGNRDGALGRLLPGLVMTGDGTAEAPGVLQGIWSSSLEQPTKIQRLGWLDSDGFLYLIHDDKHSTS